LKLKEKEMEVSGKGDKKSTTDTWLRENQELYTAATSHSFIQSIRDGTVDVTNFKRWMVSHSLHASHYMTICNFMSFHVMSFLNMMLGKNEGV
jgi:thiaminase